MIQTAHQFTTDSNPGEKQFERTARDAASNFAGLLQSAPDYYPPVKDPILLEGVRMALTTEGVATPKTVEDKICSQDFAEKYDEAERRIILEAFDEVIRGRER